MPRVANDNPRQLVKGGVKGGVRDGVRDRWREGVPWHMIDMPDRYRYTRACLSAVPNGIPRLSHGAAQLREHGNEFGAHALGRGSNSLYGVLCAFAQHAARLARRALQNLPNACGSGLEA